MNLDDSLRQVRDFGGWSPTDQIKLFGWHLHAHEQKDRFSAADIRACYDAAGMSAPTNISALINNLVTSKRPQILKDARGFRLERTVREQYDARYGQRPITIQVHKTLQELPAKLPNLAEQAYLDEALTCFRAGAFRAAAVMCWNLAYDHLCTYILTNRLVDFQIAYAAQFPKDKLVIKSRDDFHEVKESDVLLVARRADITAKNVHGVLVEN